MPQSFHNELLWTIRKFVFQLKRDLAKLPHHHLRVLHRGRHGRALCLDLAIDERKHTYLNPEILELAGHLKSDETSAGETGKMDRTRSLPL